MKAEEQKVSVTENRTIWRIDSSHSSVEFTVRKLFFLTVTGRITDLDGTIVLDENSIDASSANSTIQAKSVDTGNKQRDAQLKAASFFDVANYPEIEFESSDVAPGKDRDMLSITGLLTIKDITKEIQLDVTEVDRSKAPDGSEVIYYVAMMNLNRYDFGVSGWRGVVGGKVKVVINIQANREKLKIEDWRAR
jgi:polyisoprenoid-binding protein YceI